MQTLAQQLRNVPGSQCLSRWTLSLAYYVYNDYNLLVRILRPGQRPDTMEAQKILKKSDESALWLRMELPSWSYG